jgi:hypothetical protein
MGYRTIVAFSNDRSSSWERDPELGRKISALAASRGDWNSEASCIGLTLVECEHADTQSLIVADGYEAKTVAYTNWRQGQTNDQRDLALLKDLADRLGYNVSKKPGRKAKV